MDNRNIQNPQAEPSKRFTLTHEDYPIIENKSELELLRHIMNNTGDSWDRYRVKMYHNGVQRYSKTLTKWMKQEFLPYLNE